MNNVDQVRKMYQAFGMHEGEQTEMLPVAEMEFCLQAIAEEFQELSDAYVKQDIAGIADALVDVSIFVLGTSIRMGLPWEALFNEVMQANMKKELGEGSKARSLAGYKIDLVKPKNWKAPNIIKVLRDNGWKGLDWPKLLKK